MGLSYASAGDKENAMKQYEILTTLDDALASKLYNMITNRDKQIGKGANKK
jgi:hypothetical protein